MMGKRIITISREFGSGGRFIGMEVAQKLGVKYYDKEMIGQIAEQSGFSPKYIQENAELSPKKGLCHPRRGYLPMRFQGATRWDDPLKT